MRQFRVRLVAAVLSVGLSACGGQPDAVPAAAPQPAADANGPATLGDPVAADSVGTTADGTPSPALVDKQGAPVTLVAFDPASVPVGDGALGALPVFSMPQGYTAVDGPRIRAYARFPFRLAEGLHWVEGASWSARIGVDDDAAPDKEYSPLEVRRNLEAVLAQAGAQRVYDGPLQRDLYYGTLQDEIGDGFIEAVNYGAETPTQVYVLRRPGRTVWIQLVFDTHGAGVVAIDEQPFEATARWSRDFPHLSLPTGYAHRNRELKRDYDAFPFWTGAAFEEVAGKAYAADFDAGENMTSMHEVRRNLEAMMREAGGVQVHAGPVPAAKSETIPFERKSPYGNAAGYSWNEDDRSTWRVDLDGGRQVWVHARLDPRAAGWVVVEREGFVQTAALLSADALKQGIETEGKIAVQVNFAVDEAVILPDSQPQLAQIQELLAGDPTLRLSIEGHTDDTGDAAHNTQLSDRRAGAVVDALVASGIDGARLRSSGLGATRPIADNTTDAGRARNRRVELVKQ